MKEISFVCGSCDHKFKAEPDSVNACEATPWHPWTYQCACPVCGDPAGQVHWERNLLKGWAEATGTRSEEGLRRVRFNALKHGLSAKTATYYPARPGGYPHCNGCRYLENQDCVDYGACLSRTEILLRHMIAYDQNDPRVLSQFNAERQGHLAALADDMLLSIIQDGGPRQKTPKWYQDKDGNLQLAQYTDKHGEVVQLYELNEHPLLKRLFDLLLKNGMTLTDQNMTPKVQDDQSILRGELAVEAGEAESLSEYARRQSAALDNLAKMIENSREQLAADPVLVEHQSDAANQGDGVE